MFWRMDAWGISRSSGSQAIHRATHARIFCPPRQKTSPAGHRKPLAHMQGSPSGNRSSDKLHQLIHHRAINRCFAVIQKVLCSNPGRPGCIAFTFSILLSRVPSYLSTSAPSSSRAYCKAVSFPSARLTATREHRRRPFASPSLHSSSTAATPHTRNKAAKMSNGKTPVVAEAHEVDTYRMIPNWLPEFVGQSCAILTEWACRPPAKDAG